MLLVLENSTHDSYNDVLSLFSTRLGWFLRRVRPASLDILGLYWSCDSHHYEPGHYNGLILDNLPSAAVCGLVAPAFFPWHVTGYHRTISQMP